MEKMEVIVEVVEVVEDEDVVRYPWQLTVKSQAEHTVSFLQQIDLVEEAWMIGMRWACNGWKRRGWYSLLYSCIPGSTTALTS